MRGRNLSAAGHFHLVGATLTRLGRQGLGLRRRRLDRGGRRLGLPDGLAARNPGRPVVVGFGLEPVRLIDDGGVSLGVEVDRLGHRVDLGLIGGRYRAFLGLGLRCNRLLVWLEPECRLARRVNLGELRQRLDRLDFGLPFCLLGPT